MRSDDCDVMLLARRIDGSTAVICSCFIMPILALLRRGSGCRLGRRKAEVVVSLLAPLAPCCDGGERRWVDGFGTYGFIL